MSDLDASLLKAHARQDKPLLARLYEGAADAAAAGEEQGFFLTQAYIFALDAGLPEAAGLRARLVALGREPA